MTSDKSPAATLAMVEASIAKCAALSEQRRRDLCCSLRALARAMGRRLEEIPADPAALRVRLKVLTPAQAGVSPRRWANIKSDVGAALRHAGIACRRGRSRVALSAGWTDLRDALAKAQGGPKYLWNGVSGFAGWCVGCGIEPDSVDATTFAAYRDELEGHSLAKDPTLAFRRVGTCWAQAAKFVPEWPPGRAELPNYSRKFILDWDAFPKTLKEEFDAFLATKTQDDILGEVARKPLRASSAQCYTYAFRQYLAKLVSLGIDPGNLRSIIDALDLRLIKPGIRAFIDAGKRKSNAAAHNLAMLLRTLAVWSHASDEVRERLAAYCRRLKPEFAMSSTMQARMRVLEDPDLLRSVALLPLKILARSSPLSAYRRAKEVRAAVMVEVMLVAPMRIGNLAGLDLERHLARAGRHGARSIHIPKDEVKNSVDLDYPLPDATSRLLEVYLEVHRPLLLQGKPSNALFPGRDGKPLTVSAVRNAIERLLMTELGLDLNPHGFRHLAAQNLLKANPGHYETVRQVLGHKNIKTTTAFYCGPEKGDAFRQLAKTVKTLREPASEQARPKESDPKEASPKDPDASARAGAARRARKGPGRKSSNHQARPKGSDQKEASPKDPDASARAGAARRARKDPGRRSSSREEPDQ